MFDTTARLATEEQGLPACLPLVSFTGSERATMRYETKEGITATFQQEGEYLQPVVVLENVPGLPGKHSYHAGQFLDAAATDGHFTFGADYNDQEAYTLGVNDVMTIAEMVRRQADRRKGYFQTKWVALDPSSPF